VKRVSGAEVAGAAAGEPSAKAGAEGKEGVAVNGVKKGLGAEGAKAKRRRCEGGCTEGCTGRVPEGGVWRKGDKGGRGKGGRGKRGAGGGEKANGEVGIAKPEEKEGEGSDAKAGAGQRRWGREWH